MYHQFCFTLDPTFPFGFSRHFNMIIRMFLSTKYSTKNQSYSNFSVKTQMMTHTSVLQSGVLKNTEIIHSFSLKPFHSIEPRHRTKKLDLSYAYCRSKKVSKVYTTSLLLAVYYPTGTRATINLKGSKPGRRTLAVMTSY